MRSNLDIDVKEDAPAGKLAESQIVAREFSRVEKAKTPRHWVRGDPVATTFFNALSVAFPEGERFMIRSLAPYRGRLSPRLNADLKKFIEQEAAHSREHEDLNASLAASGYDISDLENVIKNLVRTFKNKSSLLNLTATMCIEHFTAIVAAEIIANDHHLSGADESQLPIWIWHALEEIEHKSVAFDCWDYVTRDMPAAQKWTYRNIVMLLISFSFFVNRLRGQVTLLRQDGYGRLGALRGALRFGFSKGGLGRNIIRPWARFLKFGFHPSDTDDSALMAKAERMFEELQGGKADAPADNPAATGKIRAAA